MPNKLKNKLKENEFYCVGVRKKCALKPKDICVTTWKNGANALVGDCEKYDCKATKIVKKSKVNRLVKKYGKCTKSRRKSPKRKSKSRRKSPPPPPPPPPPKRKSKSRRKSPKRKSKSRRKPCKSNQVRNRQTGRCRLKSPKRKSKSRRKSPKRKSKSRRKSPKRKSKSRRKPCKSNQVRNRQTGRCRKK